MRKRFRRGISLGTIVMLACTIGVLAAFAAMMPAFTGSQDILIDAARLAVAIDDSLSQLSASTGQMIQQHLTPQTTFVPPFTSQQAEPAISGSAAPTPVPTPTASPKRTFSLCAAGTIELDASVRKALTIQQAERFELLTDQIPQALEADISILTLGLGPGACLGLHPQHLILMPQLHLPLHGGCPGRGQGWYSAHGPPPRAATQDKRARVPSTPPRRAGFSL